MSKFGIIVKYAPVKSKVTETSTDSSKTKQSYGFWDGVKIIGTESRKSLWTIIVLAVVVVIGIFAVKGIVGAIKP